MILYVKALLSGTMDSNITGTSIREMTKPTGLEAATTSSRPDKRLRTENKSPAYQSNLSPSSSDNQDESELQYKPMSVMTERFDSRRPTSKESPDASEDLDDGVASLDARTKKIEERERAANFYVDVGKLIPNKDSDLTWYAWQFIFCSEKIEYAPLYH